MSDRQRRQHTIFTTVRSEGSILPMDLLQRIATSDPSLHGLAPDTYYLLKNEKLNEAINRSWNRLLSAWEAFRSARDKLPEKDTGTTLTRERWLLPLFYELGYGRLLTAKALEVSDRSYAISHGWQNTPASPKPGPVTGRPTVSPPATTACKPTAPTKCITAGNRRP